MKNLVIGAAKGYGWDTLEPFVTSCKRNCPDAELTLIVDDISDFTRDKLIREGVTLIDVPEELRDVVIIHSRWKILCDWLETHGADYEQVFLSDTRDVIFQGDIFANFHGLTNCLGYSTETDDIGGRKTGDKMNYSWLAGFFGKAEADKLVDKKIICCGTVVATINEMKILSRIMWKILKSETFWGYEQAAMNYLVWNNLLPIENLIEIGTDSGEIFTAGLFKEIYPIETRDDKILRGDGQIPAVVHQYDRIGYLVELVDKVYRDKNFQADLRFSDVRSVVEQTACLLYADKVADAAKLFMRKFLSTADFNVAKNSLVTVWELAAKKNFTPTIEMLELAAQSALTSVEKFSDAQMLRLHKIFIDAGKNRHAVDPTFKQNFAAHLLKIGEQNIAAGAPVNYGVHILQMTEALNLEPDEKILQFAARVNRDLEALTGGKKF